MTIFPTESFHDDNKKGPTTIGRLSVDGAAFKPDVVNEQEMDLKTDI